LDTIPIFQEWLAAVYSPNEMEKARLERLKKSGFLNISTWNEDELKMFFISPLLEEVNLQTEYFKPFTQRSFSAKINEIEVGGRVDFVIAKGKKRIKQPFFCLHEYKQEEKHTGDALGQLLIAMITSQALNEKEMPILGVYIIGRNWFFVVLEGKKYAVSKEFDATDEDIYPIFAILQKSKEIMLRYV
jgi:hypothetical protein